MAPADQFNVPEVPIVKGFPLRSPPDQLNWPLMVTGAERLMLALVMLTVSAAAGTPMGLQLPGSNQSELTAPVQVLVSWARDGWAVKARTRQMSKQSLEIQ